MPPRRHADAAREVPREMPAQRYAELRDARDDMNYAARRRLYARKGEGAARQRARRRYAIPPLHD